MALALISNQGTNMNTEDTIEISTIATSAVLIDLRVALWSGRKRDKKTTHEVVQEKKAMSKAAASVVKNLMADDVELDKIRAYGQETRMWLQKRTMPWTDMGLRLLPASMIAETAEELDARIEEFDKLVGTFLANYPNKITGMALKLGDLFDRNEFPKPEYLLRRFNMQFTITPLPAHSDFRVDVQKEMGEFLKKHYKERAEQRLTHAMRDLWERVYDSLAHAKERVEAALDYSQTVPDAQTAVTDKRRAPKLYQSIIDNAIETATMVAKLNITNDPALKDCATRMRALFAGMNIVTLREEPSAQIAAKKKLDDILGAFDFSAVSKDDDNE